MENNEKKISGFQKYKWLYLWIAAACLLVFGIVMLVNKDFGSSVVCYVTGALLILFTIIRFVPLIKTTKDKWAIAMNAIEMFIDLACGIVIIVLAGKLNEGKDYITLIYRFMVGGVLYLRAAVYFAETSFFHTKPEVLKFFINLALITVGTVIMSLKNFNPESMTLIFGIIFTGCGVFATADGIINYNNFRNNFGKKKLEKEEEISKEVSKEKEEEIKVPEEIIEDDKRDRDYVS